MATGRVADEQPEKGSDRKREEQPRQEIQESWGLSRVVVAKQCLLNSRTARYGSGQKGGKEEEGRKKGKECIKMF